MNLSCDMMSYCLSSVCLTIDIQRVQMEQNRKVEGEQKSEKATKKRAWWQDVTHDIRGYLHFILVLLETPDRSR